MRGSPFPALTRRCPRPVEYRLLGPVEVVTSDGLPLPLPGAKLRGLVVLLALDAGRVVPAARLIDALYDEPPRNTENALQQVVSRLRRILGDAQDRLVTRAPGYCLDEPVEAVDALRFERLVSAGRTAAAQGDLARAARLSAEALGLWRGPPLADAALEGGAAVLRTRLAELREAAVDDRVEWEMRLGHHAALVGELEAVVAATPLQERRWGQLMVALYRCGRQGDALQAYRQVRRTLADELGVEPGPQLRDLERAVLAHDPALAAPVPAPGAPRPPRHVPRPRTACIGRGTELARLAALVDGPGLTTLVGPGGVGKTRLALEVAQTVDHRLADGVCWVDLAPLTAGGVGEAVGHAVGFDDAMLARDGVDLVEGIGGFLARRESALVLDNCEHLVEEVATFVAALLDLAPDLCILATSREGLSVPGEVLFPVAPLSLDAAVALFAERARAGGAAPAEDAGELVAEICHRLDRLPLAVELAAARARHLDIAEIARRIDRRFELLTAGPRTAVTRQRTLRAVIDWSYALLEEPERALFTRLAVFDGGFTLAAAEAVDEREGTLDRLASLVDKSLVVAEPSGVELRYHLLESLHAYGREQLRAAGSGEAQRAHRAYFVDFAADAAEGLMTSGYSRWRRRVEAELPNIRGAWQSAIAAGAPDDALRIATSLRWFWTSTDRHREGRRRIEDALRAAEPTADPLVRARALTVLGFIAGQQLDLEIALAAGQRALAGCLELGDELDVAVARYTLALTFEAADDHERSTELLARARPVWDAAGMHTRVMSVDLVTCVRALATGDLDLADETSRDVLRRCALISYEPFRCWGHLARARLAEARHDLSAAGVACDAALASARSLGLAHYVSFSLAQSGRIAALVGDVAHAEAALTEAVDTAEQAGAGWFAAFARVALADVRRTQGDPAGAETLLRQVVEWSAGPVAGVARATFFRRLGGDPVATATARLVTRPSRR
jgi:predicted ATPase/DNA-binding SARP family transcriptional activator